MLAWWWGASLPPEMADLASYLAVEAAHPGELMTPDAQRAWDRLGPRRFWRWALAGMRAAAEEELRDDDARA